MVDLLPLASMQVSRKHDWHCINSSLSLLLFSSPLSLTIEKAFNGILAHLTNNIDLDKQR